jgi:hypothetical protein
VVSGHDTVISFDQVAQHQERHADGHARQPSAPRDADLTMSAKRQKSAPSDEQADIRQAV